MGLTYSKTVYQSGNQILPIKRFSILSDTINPRCIGREFGPSKGDVILYEEKATRLGDDATTTFSIDSDGIPTVVGVDGTFGHKWGAYECTIKINGTEKITHVNHVEDVDTLAVCAPSLNLDSNGWTIWEPPAGARLIYVDPDITGYVIDGQGETDYAVFSGGSGYSVNDVITVTNGTTITVDAVDVGNAVTQFTVNAATDTGGNVATDVLSQTGVVPAGGTGFSLTLAAGNLRTSANQGPAGNDTNFYVMGTSEPGAGWKTPGSGAVNAYETMAEAFADMREGFGDVMLLNSASEHRPTAQIQFSGKSGASSSARSMVTSYGTTGNERATINPDFTTTDVFYSFTDDNLGFTDLDIYPKWHDPDDASWAGWSATTAPGRGIAIYTGGGAPDPENNARSGFLIENVRIRFCSGGISLFGSQGLKDTIIRRNVIEYNYDERGRAQGFSTGGRSSSLRQYPYWAYLLEQNVFNHNGWLRQTYNISGTASSGNTTTLTDTGAFAGLDLEDVALIDDRNGGTTRIESNTDDVVTFTAAANVDFTGGGSYGIGNGQVPFEDTAQGQAIATNHNMYTRIMRYQICQNNLTILSSSIAQKTTADSFAGDWTPIDGQDETNYNGVGSNGTFVGGDGAGGTAYGVSDTITLSSGSIVTVDAVDGNGDVTGFTLNSSSDDGLSGSTDTLTQSASSGSGLGFTLTLDSNNVLNTEENDPNNFASEDFIQRWTTAIDCELGLGGGGNTDYQEGPRFKDFRCCDNLQIDFGLSDQTLRGGGVARGFGVADWINGLCSGNISMNFVGTNNPAGFGVNGHVQNTVIASNRTLNSGVDNTGTDNGSMYIRYIPGDTGYQDVFFIKNAWKETGQAVIFGDFSSPDAAEITMLENRYDYARADASAVNIDGASASFADFLTTTGETGGKQTITHSDASATIGTYNASRGGTGTTAAFIAEARELSKENWDDTLTSLYVYAYFDEALGDA